MTKEAVLRDDSSRLAVLNRPAQRWASLPLRSVYAGATLIGRYVSRVVAPLETGRLRILPCSREAATAALQDRHELAQIIGARVPAEWPGEIGEVLPLYAQQIADDPTILGWGPWLAIERRRRALVGDLGFKGKPDAGRVEIGYGIVPEFRRLGHASEAVRALVDWAFDQPDVTAIVAECNVENHPSIRILERLGMTMTRVDSDISHWGLSQRR